MVSAKPNRKRRVPGDGSIYQLKTGKWRASLWINNSRTTKVFDSYRDASEYLKKTSVEVAEGIKPVKTKMTVGEYLAEWANTRIGDLSESSQVMYRLCINKHIIPEIGTVLLRDLDGDKIVALYNTLREKGVGGRTRVYVHQTLHAAFEDAARPGTSRKINLNPVQYVSKPQYDQEEIVILNQEQIRIFLDTSAKLEKSIAANGNPAYTPIYHVALSTGLRLSELLGLRWRDIDLASGRMTLQKQLRRKVSDTTNTHKKTKTRAGARTLRLGDKVLQMLRDYKIQQMEVAEKYKNSWQEQGLMFPSLRGTPMGARNLQRHFRSVVTACSFDADFAKLFHFHCLRHTAVSILLTKLDINTVSKLIGHSSVSITIDIYGHLIEGQTEIAAKIMDEVVFATDI